MCRKYNAIIDMDKTDSTNIEPVTLIEAKRHIQIDFNDLDLLITDFIKASRVALEKYTGLSLVSSEAVVILRNEKGGVELPYGPYEEDSIEMFDRDNKPVTDFKITGIKFPVIEEPITDYLRVTYECGYTAQTIPYDLKRAICQQVAYMNENRGDGKLSESAMELAKPYKSKVWLL